MRYNKLLSRKSRLDINRTNGVAPVIDERRCSGRTTSIKLLIISNCIAKPGEWFLIDDHDSDTAYRRQTLTDEIMSTIKQLGLKHFERRHNMGGTIEIRSNHFTDNPWEIE